MACASFYGMIESLCVPPGTIDDTVPVQLEGKEEERSGGSRRTREGGSFREGEGGKDG